MQIDNQPKKSHLLTSLEEVVLVAFKLLVVNCLVLHGASIMNFLKLNQVAKFADYVNRFFQNMYWIQLKYFEKIHIVGDENIPNSLKTSACSRRRTDIKRSVLYFLETPGNWQSFLHLE